MRKKKNKSEDVRLEADNLNGSLRYLLTKLAISRREFSVYTGIRMRTLQRWMSEPSVKTSSNAPAWAFTLLMLILELVKEVGQAEALKRLDVIADKLTPIYLELWGPKGRRKKG